MSGCVREHEENRHSKKRGKQAEVRVGPTVVQEAFNADASVWKPKVTVKHCFCLQIVYIRRAYTSEKVYGTCPEIKKNVKKWNTDSRPTDEGGDDKPAPVSIRNPRRLSRFQEFSGFDSRLCCQHRRDFPM